MDKVFAIGDIIVNELRQHAKIISFKNGVYGLSGWTTLINAEKANVVQSFMNVYGMAQANISVVSSSSKPSQKAKEETVKSKPSKKKTAKK